MGDPLVTCATSVCSATASLQEAHKLGFMRAAGWAKRDDLRVDVDSPAYLNDQQSDLQALVALHPMNTQQPIPAQAFDAMDAETLADLIPLTAKVIEQDGKPIGVRMNYAQIRQFSKALASHMALGEPLNKKDLSMLVRRLAREIKFLAPNNRLSAAAMEYLERKGLNGSPLRASETPADFAEVPSST